MKLNDFIESVDLPPPHSEFRFSSYVQTSSNKYTYFKAILKSWNALLKKYTQLNVQQIIMILQYMC